MHYKHHALEVVNRFKGMLNDSAIDEIGEEHFQELETLIAAALGVVDSQCRNEVAEQLQSALNQIKKDASYVDRDYLASSGARKKTDKGGVI